MITCSTFCKWLFASERYMPRSAFLAIKREGRDRLVTRLRAAEADEPLDFSDLVSRGEDAIAGRLA